MSPSLHHVLEYELSKIESDSILDVNKRRDYNCQIKTLGCLVPVVTKPQSLRIKEFHSGRAPKPHVPKYLEYVQQYKYAARNILPSTLNMLI